VNAYNDVYAARDVAYTRLQRPVVKSQLATSAAGTEADGGAVEDGESSIIRSAIVGLSGVYCSITVPWAFAAAALAGKVWSTLTDPGRHRIGASSQQSRRTTLSAMNMLYASVGETTMYASEEGGFIGERGLGQLGFDTER
jgi:hypothetical protein